MTAPETKGDVVRVAIAEIERGDNYRTSLDGRVVADIKDSFLANGQLSPIGVVRREKKFRLVFGEHRTEAALQLGWTEILARVFSDLSAVDEISLRLQDNLLKADNDPIETALECERLKEKMGGTNKEVAKKAGISESYLCKLLKRLKGDPRLIALVKDRTIPGRAFDAIMGVKDEAKREAVVALAVKDRLTADKIEILCKEARDPKAATRKLALKLANDVSVCVYLPAVARVAGVVAALDGLAKEAKRCAATRPAVRDFLTQLSLNLSAPGGGE